LVSSFAINLQRSKLKPTAMRFARASKKTPAPLPRKSRVKTSFEEYQEEKDEQRGDQGFSSTSRTVGHRQRERDTPPKGDILHHDGNHADPFFEDHVLFESDDEEDDDTCYDSLLQISWDKTEEEEPETLNRKAVDKSKQKQGSMLFWKKQKDRKKAATGTPISDSAPEQKSMQRSKSSGAVPTGNRQQKAGTGIHDYTNDGTPRATKDQDNGREDQQESSPAAIQPRHVDTTVQRDVAQYQYPTDEEVRNAISKSMTHEDEMSESSGELTVEDIESLDREDDEYFEKKSERGILVLHGDTTESHVMEKDKQGKRKRFLFFLSPKHQNTKNNGVNASRKMEMKAISKEMTPATDESLRSEPEIVVLHAGDTKSKVFLSETDKNNEASSELNDAVTNKASEDGKEEDEKTNENTRDVYSNKNTKVNTSFFSFPWVTNAAPEEAEPDKIVHAAEKSTGGGGGIESKLPSTTTVVSENHEDDAHSELQAQQNDRNEEPSIVETAPTSGKEGDNDNTSHDEELQSTDKVTRSSTDAAVKKSFFSFPWVKNAAPEEVEPDKTVQEEETSNDGGGGIEPKLPSTVVSGINEGDAHSELQAQQKNINEEPSIVETAPSGKDDNDNKSRDGELQTSTDTDTRSITDDVDRTETRTVESDDKSLQTNGEIDLMSGEEFLFRSVFETDIIWSLFGECSTYVISSVKEEVCGMWGDCEHCQKPFTILKPRTAAFVASPKCKVMGDFHSKCLKARKHVQNKKDRVLGYIALIGSLQRREHAKKVQRRQLQQQKEQQEEQAALASRGRSWPRSMLGLGRRSPSPPRRRGASRARRSRSPQPQRHRSKSPVRSRSAAARSRSPQRQQQQRQERTRSKSPMATQKKKKKPQQRRSRSRSPQRSQIARSRSPHRSTSRGRNYRKQVAGDTTPKNKDKDKHNNVTQGMNNKTKTKTNAINSSKTVRKRPLPPELVEV
jgi:hypothetical protein